MHSTPCFQGNFNSTFALYDQGIPSFLGQAMMNLTFKTQAVEWFQKAAKAGDSNAMYNLGVLYTQGVEGVPENQQLAFDYFSQVLIRIRSKCQQTVLI